jgi:hypothetical protein
MKKPLEQEDMITLKHTRLGWIKEAGDSLANRRLIQCSEYLNNVVCSVEEGTQPRNELEEGWNEVWNWKETALDTVKNNPAIAGRILEQKDSEVDMFKVEVDAQRKILSLVMEICMKFDLIPKE